jgi:alpha-L-fucosidase 2
MKSKSEFATNMLSLACGLLVAVTVDTGLAEELPAPAGGSVLWYRAPAQNWEKEALPIGNGRLGGMIFGGIDREQIQFNEDTLWIGDEKDTGAYQTFGDLYIDFGDAVGTVGVWNPSRHQGSRGQEVDNFGSAAKSRWRVSPEW